VLVSGEKKLVSFVLKHFVIIKLLKKKFLLTEKSYATEFEFVFFSAHLLSMSTLLSLLPIFFFRFWVLMLINVLLHYSYNVLSVHCKFK